MWSLIIPKRRHVVALIIFLALFLPLLYTVARHTEPYETAEQFLLSDDRVASSVGPVDRIDFRFWEGFHFTGGDANFTFEVTGSKGTSIIEMHLRNSSGVWRVVTADVRASDGSTSRIVGFALESLSPSRFLESEGNAYRNRSRPTRSRSRRHIVRRSGSRPERGHCDEVGEVAD